jgi:hypothetical protein
MINENDKKDLSENIFAKKNRENGWLPESPNDFLPKESNQTEGRIQSDCFQWFNNSFPALRGLMYHVPNGGKRHIKEAMDFKAMGVVAGVPDLEFHFWRRTFFLECKTPQGVLSKEQVKIHQILDQHGFRVFVFRSLEEFQTIIWAILEDKSTEFSRGLTRIDFDYRNKVFNYLYDMIEGEVQIIENLTAKENYDKFRSVIFEFVSDGFDKIEGFEILFTNDYSGFYKKNLTVKTEVHFNGSTTQELPE